MAGPGRKVAGRAERRFALAQRRAKIVWQAVFRLPSTHVRKEPIGHSLGNFRRATAIEVWPGHWPPLVPPRITAVATSSCSTCGELTAMCDYFVLATGTSRRQLHAISEEIDDVLQARVSRSSGWGSRATPKAAGSCWTMATWWSTVRRRKPATITRSNNCGPAAARAARKPRCRHADRAERGSKH